MLEVVTRKLAVIFSKDYLVICHAPFQNAVPEMRNHCNISPFLDQLLAYPNETWMFHLGRAVNTRASGLKVVSNYGGENR